jgi:phospholipase C
MMIDLGVDAYFPTLSSKTSSAVPLMFLSPSPDPGAVTDGDTVWLVSTESGLVADNFLGAWSDSHDCYWFDQYLDGEYVPNQQWMLHNVAGPAPVMFGQSVRLVNASFNQGLARDSRLGQGKWITTSGNGDTWQIVPCPKQQ